MPPLLEIQNLHTYFLTRSHVLKAVDGVSLQIEKGLAVGLLGESGCGKTMTALSVMRLLPYPAKVVDGRVIFDGADLVGLSEEEMRNIRGSKIGMVFQDPMASLNPLYTVGEQIAEVFRHHQGISGNEASLLATDLLAAVGIPDPVVRAKDYPHQLSGGMRQRVMIAMALALKPALLILDEPTSALDVTVQAQILELVKSLRRSFGSSILLITHDFGVAAELCDRISVMYAGQIVESTTKQRILAEPLHPYTQGLLRCLPSLAKEKGSLQPVHGTVPTLTETPRGCRFHPRCPYAFTRCYSEEPQLIEAQPGHFVRCYLYTAG